MSKKITKNLIEMDLKKLLENINLYLGSNFDEMYNHLVIRKDIKEEYLFTLKWQKENMKNQIKNYFDIIIKNIIYHNKLDSKLVEYLNNCVLEED